MVVDMSYHSESILDIDPAQLMVVAMSYPSETILDIDPVHLMVVTMSYPSETSLDIDPAQLIVVAMSYLSETSLGIDPAQLIMVSMLSSHIPTKNKKLLLSSNIILSNIVHVIGHMCTGSHHCKVQDPWWSPT